MANKKFGIYNNKNKMEEYLYKFIPYNNDYCGCKVYTYFYYAVYFFKYLNFYEYQLI